MRPLKKRITVDLDVSLLHAVDEIVRQSRYSRNDVVSQSLRNFVKQRERERIDRLFEDMATDDAYRREVLRIEEEMSAASDRTWKPLDSMAVPTGHRKGAGQGRSRRAEG